MPGDLRSRMMRNLRIAIPTLVRLLARMLSTVLAATLLVFVLLEVSFPGGFRAAVLGGDSRSARAQRIIEDNNLDENVLVRYLYWVADAFRGDFGRSTTNGESVTELIVPRLSISLEIMLVAVVLTVAIGIPLGLLAVQRDGRPDGRLLNMVLGFAQSVPVYVTPLFLIAFFAVKYGWFPAAGWTRISESFTGNLKGLVLPMTALVLAEIGTVARIVRGDVLRVMDSDFIAAAHCKGMSDRYVLFRHALRPASLGLLNVISLNIGSLLTGALIIELIFGIGAMGQVLLESTLNRDLPVILGVTTYVVLVYVLLNTIVDGLMVILDPRTRSR